MAERILITGGAGYLGCVLSETLLSRGYSVTILDNLMYGQRPLFALCHHPQFDFVFGDARDRDVVHGLLKQADVIIPLAAVVGAPACDRDPWLAQQVNFEAVKLIHDLRSGQQKIIYPNTNSGYGIQSGASYCTEETPLTPITLYGRTKVDAEELLLNSENVVTFRLATVFGTSPRMRLDLLVNDFVHQALTQRTLVLFEKDFKRNFVHIRDVADAFIYALENFSQLQGRCYNLGLDSANLSKLELAQLIQRFVPNLNIFEASLGEDPDKRNYIVSNERLRQAGFQARRSLEDGIQELLKAYRMLNRQEFRNV